MTVGQSLLREFDEEMAATRRVIERVPDDKAEWRPHPKSFPLAHLTQLVATMPGWVLTMLKERELDLGKGGSYSVQKVDTLLATFDQLAGAARAALDAASDESMAEPWTLRHGAHVIYTMPRRDVVRQTISHLVHHRAQLTVYLRLLDVPVPSMYGPTADEPFQFS